MITGQSLVELSLQLGVNSVAIPDFGSGRTRSSNRVDSKSHFLTLPLLLRGARPYCRLYVSATSTCNGNLLRPPLRPQGQFGPAQAGPYHAPYIHPHTTGSRPPVLPGPARARRAQLDCLRKSGQVRAGLDHHDNPDWSGTVWAGPALPDRTDRTRRARETLGRPRSFRAGGVQTEFDSKLGRRRAELNRSRCTKAKLTRSCDGVATEGD